MSALGSCDAGAGPNTCFGYSSLGNLASGINNIALGYNSGNSYTTSESSNIDIGSTGRIGDNNTIRLGTQGSGAGQQNRNFQAGITGVTVAASSPVSIASTGQLSDLGFGTATQVLTSNGSGVSPSWQAAGGGGATTYFQAYRTTNQTIAGGNTSTTIIFDTAIDNVGGAYNTSTGVFTAPATGYYAFASTVFFNNLTTPAGLSQVILAYNGSVQSLRLEQFGLVPATTGAALICTASWSMPMTAGDTIQMQPFADGTGNYVVAGGSLASGAFNTASTFSGFRVA